MSIKTPSQFLVFSLLISLSSTLSQESLLPILPLRSSNELDVKMMLFLAQPHPVLRWVSPSPQAREVISHADGLSGVGGSEHSLGLDPSCSYGVWNTRELSPSFILPFLSSAFLPGELVGIFKTQKQALSCQDDPA